MDAQRAVGRIVGRDTQCLDRDGVTRAAVETVAENTSDGVIAPLFWLALGGLPLGMVYKAVNTMDSMVGYRNERYLFFGRAAARTDDAANYLPARLSALLMCLAAALLPGFRGRDALRIWRRDRRKHKSPNSAQTEAACAGALGVQLAGDASYFGTLVRKPTIGEAERPIRPEDIPAANRLMYGTEVLCLALCRSGSAVFSHIQIGGSEMEERTHGGDIYGLERPVLDLSISLNPFGGAALRHPGGAGGTGALSRLS